MTLSTNLQNTLLFVDGHLLLFDCCHLFVYFGIYVQARIKIIQSEKKHLKQSPPRKILRKMDVSRKRTNYEKRT